MEDDNFSDGHPEQDDKGIRVYWDAESKEFLADKEYCTQRFLAVLEPRGDFEGFDEYCVGCGYSCCECDSIDSF